MKKAVLSLFVQCILILSIGTVTYAFEPIRVASSVRIPMDSSQRVEFVEALSRFTYESQRGLQHLHNYDTTVWQNRMLIDELSDLSASNVLKDPQFYKAQLVSMVELADSSYRLQIAYIGVHDSTAVLRALVRLRARVKTGQSTYFSADTKFENAAWSHVQCAHICFHSSEPLRQEAALNYTRNIRIYDSLLQADILPTDLYCFETLSDVLSAIGIEYNSDLSGRLRGTSNCVYAGHEYVLSSSGGAAFAPIDPHDLWHARLRRVENMKLVNKAVDEGCAFLLGGSWGLSWESIRNSFRTWRSSRPEINWHDEYVKGTNIAPKGSYPLQVDYMINAYVVREVERRKGFGAVRDLLRCGLRQMGDANYFSALERITGVKESEFHQWIDKLLNEEGY